MIFRLLVCLILAQALPAGYFTEMATRYEQSFNLEQLGAHWGLNKFFGSIYVINLDRRPDRWEQVVKNLEKIGLYPGTYERVSAVDGKEAVAKRDWQRVIGDSDIASSREEWAKAVFGTFLSHYNILRDVNDKYTKACSYEEIKKYSSVLIFEDDIAFGQCDVQDRNLSRSARHFLKGIKEIPHFWDMIYFFSWRNIKTAPYKQENTPLRHISRCCGCIGLPAYAVHARAYPILLAKMEEILFNPEHPVEPIDEVFAKLQQILACYTFREPITYTFASYSDTIQKDNDNLPSLW